MRLEKKNFSKITVACHCCLEGGGAADTLKQSLSQEFLLDAVVILVILADAAPRVNFTVVRSRDIAYVQVRAGFAFYGAKKKAEAGIPTPALVHEAVRYSQSDVPSAASERVSKRRSSTLSSQGQHFNG